jgi:hypothetical protein
MYFEEFHENYNVTICLTLVHEVRVIFRYHLEFLWGIVSLQWYLMMCEKFSSGIMIHQLLFIVCNTLFQNTDHERLAVHDSLWPFMSIYSSVINLHVFNVSSS